MSYFFIINPKAGGGHGHKVEQEIKSFFNNKQKRVETVITKHKGHGLELSRRALLEGFTNIAAVGGDGSIREVAEPLIGKAANLCILPFGSGNGLARNLSLPLDYKKALIGLYEWPVKKIDVGLANGKPFFCAFGVGLDAQVAQSFNNRPGGKRGILPYVYHSIYTFLKYKPEKVLVTANGGTKEHAPLIAAVLNGRQYGGGATVAPDAYIDDGVLNLVLINRAGILRTLRAVPDLFNGKLLRNKDFISTEASRLLEFSCKPDTAFHLDGEDFTTDGKITITVLHKALNVKAPL